MTLYKSKTFLLPWTVSSFKLYLPRLHLICAHHAVVTELVAFLFALMGADEELEVVSSQHFLGDIGPPIAAAASHLVGYAAILGHWVAPQHVHNLQSCKLLNCVHFVRTRCWTSETLYSFRHLLVSTRAHRSLLVLQTLGLSQSRTLSVLRRTGQTQPICASFSAPHPLTSWADCSLEGSGASGVGGCACEPVLSCCRSENTLDAGPPPDQRPPRSCCSSSEPYCRWLHDGSAWEAWELTHTAHIEKKKKHRLNAFNNHDHKNISGFVACKMPQIHFCSLTLCLSILAIVSRSVVSEIPPCTISTLWSITVARGSQLKIFWRSFRIFLPCICKSSFTIFTIFSSVWTHIW